MSLRNKYILVFAMFSLLLAISAFATSDEEDSPQLPPATFYGVTLQYDAAGNRVFRSKMPEIEVPPFVLPEDTLVTGPDDGPGDGPVIEP